MYFARDGDPSLYDYTTTKGTTTSTSGRDATAVPAGGTPKSLLRVIKAYCDLRNGKRKIYATILGALLNIGYQIDGIQSKHRLVFCFRCIFWLTNLYYQDSYVQSTYLRTNPGSVSYPQNPASNGPANPWTVANMPAALLMFGGMEGKIWPYPNKTATSASWYSNKAPSVKFTMPLANTKFIVGADVVINVDATDNDWKYQ